MSKRSPIVKVGNTCPGCTGGPYKRIGSTNYLECQSCGYCGPKSTFDSMEEYDRHRLQFRYSFSVANQEEAETNLKRRFEEDLEELKTRREDK